MEKRTPPLLLVVATLLASVLGSVTAIVATAGTASACSVVGPQLIVTPSNQLQANESFTVSGRHFYDLVPHDTPLPDDHRGGMCDFDMVPMRGLEVWWNGAARSVMLGVVDGADFDLLASVPSDAAWGPASITVDWVTAEIIVGPTIEPPPEPCHAVVGDAVWCPEPCSAVANDAVWCPEPCPVVAHEAVRCPEPCSAVAHEAVWCPEPCSAVANDAVWCPEQCSAVANDAVWCPEPCALPGTARSAASESQATTPDVAPGYLPHCPEPCLDAAHTVEGMATGDPWGCPHPCGYEVDPGAPTASAVWCPEPCEAVGGDAIWCPEPCEAVGGDAVWCPEPCEAVGGDAVWCPEPCEAVGGDAIWCPEPCEAVGGDAIWCPEPCPEYRGASDGSDRAAAIWCPEPCEVVGGDAIWCPEPLPLVSPPSPTGAAPANEPAMTATSLGASGVAEASEPASLTTVERLTPSAGGVADPGPSASSAIAEVSRRVVRLADLLRALVLR